MGTIGNWCDKYILVDRDLQQQTYFDADKFSGSTLTNLPKLVREQRIK